MIFEIEPSDWKDLDPISKQCILDDYKDCLKEEGYSDENVNIECEILQYELDNYNYD